MQITKVRLRKLLTKAWHTGYARSEHRQGKHSVRGDVKAISNLHYDEPKLSRAELKTVAIMSQLLAADDEAAKS